MPGLYVHIPFCASACPYCDFAFVVRQEHRAGRYVESLCTELRSRIRELADRPRLDTVYFGGGTPSAISAEEIARVLAAAGEVADVPPECEITLEANPNDAPRFGAFHDIGITRLSLGVQALNDRALKALGRFHTTEDARGAFRAARDAGFDNVNVDLIFGAPGQTPAEWRETLDAAVDLSPEHMSVYGLTIEPGTPFHARHAKGRLVVPEEDAQAGMYAHTLDRLDAAGFAHYEVSNFARPGRESRHNLGCWRGDTYLGIGMGAHSYTGDARSWNVGELDDYLAAVANTGTASGGAETLTDDRHRLERVMLGLRTSEGVPDSLLRGTADTGMIDDLLRRRLIERFDASIRLTRSGYLVADSVCEALTGAL